MPQSPIATYSQYPGGRFSTLNITAQTVIKASAGCLYKFVVNAPGSTSGAFALNDAATTGAVAASNLVWQLAYNATNNLEGAIFTIDWPFQNGIVVSVPGGSPICSVSWL